MSTGCLDSSLQNIRCANWQMSHTLKRLHGFEMALLVHESFKLKYIPVSGVSDWTIERFFISTRPCTANAKHGNTSWVKTRSPPNKINIQFHSLVSNGKIRTESARAVVRHVDFWRFPIWQVATEVYCGCLLVKCPGYHQSCCKRGHHHNMVWVMVRNCDIGTKKRILLLSQQ